MSAIEKAVVDGLEAAEEALFLSAVEAIPTKPTKKTGGKKKAKAAPVAEAAAAPEAVAPVADDLAAKNQSVVEAAFAKAKVSAPAKPVDAPVDTAFDALDALDLEGMLLGDIKPEFDRMTEIRSRAYELMNKLGSMDLPGLKKSTGKRVFEFKKRIPEEAMAQIRDDLKRRCKGDWDKFKNLSATFDAMRDNWFRWENDPALDVAAKAKMQGMIDAWIANYPGGRLKESHESNLAEAEKLELELLDVEIRHEEMFQEATRLFEEANAIAAAHGWTQTSKKEKANKGGDANRK